MLLFAKEIYAMLQLAPSYSIYESLHDHEKGDVYVTRSSSLHRMRYPPASQVCDLQRLRCTAEKPGGITLGVQNRRTVDLEINYVTVGQHSAIPGSAGI